LRVGVVVLAVFIVNLPFGFWRAGLERFTLPWFLAIHAPVPLVIGMRLLSGIGWQLSTIPVLASAFVAGQLVGGYFRRHWRGRRDSPLRKA